MEDKLHKPKRKDLRRLIFLALKNPWDGHLPANRRHFMVSDSITEPGRATSIMLTLDEGYHASGWWKNSDYDRCLHLSVTHPTLTFDSTNMLETPTDKELSAWVEAVFGRHAHKCWVEPAASALDPHRIANVPHVRLFIDKNNIPLLPKGEVYHLKPWADRTSPEKVFGRSGI